MNSFRRRTLLIFEALLIALFMAALNLATAAVEWLGDMRELAKKIKEEW